MRISLFLVLGVLSIFALPLLATTIHVPGDYATIQQGINAAVNGDTVLVAAGTYTESLDYNGKSIIVISLEGPLSTIITNNPSIDLIVFDEFETHESVLEGFTLQGGRMAIWCKDAGPTLRKSIIRDQNINTWATISLGGQGMGTYGLSPIIIENCTIVGGINGALSSFSTDTVTVINTIIAFNDYGIHVQNPGTCPIKLGYNDVFGNGVNYYNISNYGLGTISLDPLFNPDYSLQSNSPCIDAGDPNSPLDPDGTIADMGALYYGQIITDFGFDVADTYGENGEPVNVPVSVYGLNDQDIAGVEFHISFDNLCLQYDTTTSSYIADMLINVFVDEIHILWEDYANPVF